MSKPSSLWLRKRDNCWMTTLNGRQIRLSKDKAEARRLFHRLMGEGRPEPGAGVTCRRLLDDYLAKTERSPGRVVSLVRYFGRFCTAFGHRRAEGMKPHELDDWLDAQPGAESSRAFARSAIVAGFRWGAAQGRIARYPFEGARKRRIARRDRLVTDAEFAAAMAPLKPYWRDYYAVLLATGMRPVSEAAALTAASLDPANCRAVLRSHKTAAKTGKPRVIYFPPAAWEIVAALAARRPSGPLFRTGVGTAVSVPRANQQLMRACKAAGVDPFPPYLLRHKMISDALGRGVPVEVLATLVGNRPATLRKHYSHLTDDGMAPVLSAAAARAVG